MFLEGLIVLACVQGSGGCTESTQAYYKHNKEVQLFADGVKEKAKKLAQANEWVVYAATPAYTLLVAKQAKIKLSKAWVLKLDVKDPGVGLEWTW